MSTPLRSLAKLCAQRSIVLIYISTDYVFAGRPGDAPYESDAVTGPTNLYGQTKLDGEHVVLEEYKSAGKKVSVLSCEYLFFMDLATTPAESAVNILMDSVQKAQQDGVHIKMDHWALRYPTNTEDVGRVCHGMLLLPTPVPPSVSSPYIPISSASRQHSKSLAPIPMV